MKTETLHSLTCHEMLRSSIEMHFEARTNRGQIAVPRHMKCNFNWQVGFTGNFVTLAIYLIFSIK